MQHLVSYCCGSMNVIKYAGVEQKGSKAQCMLPKVINQLCSLIQNVLGSVTRDESADLLCLSQDRAESSTHHNKQQQTDEHTVEARLC